MTSSLFNIRQSQLDNLKHHIKSMKLSQWDIFDVDCKRHLLENTQLTIGIINDCLSKIHKIHTKNITIHYVKYDLEESYLLDEHNDGCKKTIIIYLEKDSSIKDTFYVNNKLVNNSNWAYNGFIMDGTLKHHGIFEGQGKRNILCIFIN
jgi:hypothetical protein